MAIVTEDFIEKFGTQDALDDSSATVVDDAVSLAGDLSEWTNDDDAPFAVAILEFDYAVNPTVGSSVLLLAQLIDVSGTDDTEPPTTTYLHIPLGTFPVKGQITPQFASIRSELPNTKTSQVYQFYILNNKTGQTIQAGWDLRVTPYTIGPHV